MKCLMWVCRVHVESYLCAVIKYAARKSGAEQAHDIVLICLNACKTRREVESFGGTLPQDLAYRRDDIALKGGLYGEDITAAVSGDKK